MIILLILAMIGLNIYPAPYSNNDNTEAVMCTNELYEMNKWALPLNNRSEDIRTMLQGEIRPGGIILYSKFRTGSTFLSNILSTHPDVYFLYEPLAHVSDCQDKITAERALAYLRQCAGCKFTGLIEKGVHDISYIYKLSENEMALYWEWREDTFCGHSHVLNQFNISRSVCRNGTADFHENVCLNLPRIAMKTIRVQQLQHIWNLVSDGVQIIQLVRDPRGVLHSRLQLVGFKDGNWFPNLIKHPPVFDNLTSAALQYCEEIKRDVLFIQKYRTDTAKQGRYMLVRYEDVTRNPHLNALKLYRFLGLSAIGGEFKSLEKYYTLKTLDENPFLLSEENPWTIAQKWRYNMPWKNVQQIQVACSFVMRQLGYRSFDSEEQLRDAGFDSVTKDLKFI